MEDVLKIAICEDSENDKNKLISMIQQQDIPTTITVYSNGEELLDNYVPHTFDLLLVDIYMDGITGVEVIDKIRDIDKDIPAAFITSSTEHALEGYRLSVLKYIEKPIKEEDVLDILNLAVMKRDSAPMLTVQKNGRYERIRFSRIVYLEQQTHQLFLYLQDGSTEQVYEKLSSLLPQLEGQPFFQSHKSFAVNLSFVRYIDTELKCFVMQNDKYVPIRRESMSRAKRALQEFLFNKTRGEGY